MPRGGSVVDAIEVASTPSSLSTIFPALSLIASLFATRLFEAVTLMVKPDERLL
jgi:hypothetical protein